MQIQVEIMMLLKMFKTKLKSFQKKWQKTKDASCEDGARWARQRC